METKKVIDPLEVFYQEKNFNVIVAFFPEDPFLYFLYFQKIQFPGKSVAILYFDFSVGSQGAQKIDSDRE